ncbi:helix-turn-helix domain-containing protein [Bernardetia sp. Wsw4-3y2]|uniref:helix-turn-helix domain-containing protein n=1 Tax=Bernardetia sp. Wsw4-3y2 TaxID=3127471 RepID=UPI0030D193CE
MGLEKQILFFFSALGAFNGFLLAAYFVFFSKKKNSDYFLGGLLFVISVRITKSIFLFFNDKIFDIFIQIGLSACLLIGVFLDFYIKASSDSDSEKAENKNKSTYWWIHVLLWLICISIFNYFYSYSENRLLWNYFVKMIYLQWFVYILLSAWELRNELKKLFTKNTKLSESQIWQVNIFFGVLCIWTAYVFGSYASYIVGALSFSFVFYILGLFWFLKRSNSTEVKNKISKDQQLHNLESNKEKAAPKPIEKYANKKIDEQEANQLKTRIERIIAEEELFRDPNLKLPDLAEKINVLPHYLSQFLNDNLNKSFPLYINEHRIEAAKKLLLLNDSYTLEAIGYECGFNSKSTFFSTFKKITNYTPASYKKKYKK